MRPTLNLLAVLNLLGAAQGLLLTLALLTVKRGNRLPNKLLAGLTLSIAIIVTGAVLLTTNYVFVYPHLSRVHHPFVFLAGPLLFSLHPPILYDTYDPAADNGQPPAPPPDKSRLPSILRKIPLSIPDIFGSSGGGSGSTRAEYDRGERYLRDLAERTGGRLYEANKDLSALQAAFGLIADELRRQYTIGYYPKKKTGAGERRQIKVRTDIPNVAVRARDSYIYQGAAATQGTANPGEPGKQSTSAPVLQKKPFTNE